MSNTDVIQELNAIRAMLETIEENKQLKAQKFKAIEEIDNKINKIIEEIALNNAEIKVCLEWQKYNGKRITKDCDYIKFRNQNILMLTSQKEILDWVLRLYK